MSVITEPISFEKQSRCADASFANSFLANRVREGIEEVLADGDAIDLGFLSEAIAVWRESDNRDGVGSFTAAAWTVVERFNKQ